ncbi:MAG: ABC-F family ATP-binding cassette domain-containing protein, partial [Terriglobales bacterium]
RRLWAAMEERERIYAKPEMSDADGMRLGELEGIVGEEDGYAAESDAAVLLNGLGIGADLQERAMRELQGGEKIRVLLAQALFGHPQALLLDEPTNHLDLDSIEWLQNFLLRYDGALVVISHDRHFLNRACTHIADIDYQTIITYTGGYDDMVVAKTQIRSRLESENEVREKKIDQLNDFIARFSAGTRSSQVQSRRKEVERLQVTDLARSNIARPFIRFEMRRPSGKNVLECEDVAKSYGERPLFTGFGAQIMRGEKIAVLGRNGAGKTSLLRSLLDDGCRDAGHVRWGHEVQIGYFPQDQGAEITGTESAFSWLTQWDPDAPQEQIRGLLGQMLFRREEGDKSVAVLSGGETARLLFCKLMLQQPNLLIMDEPTNHLDLESINALNVALQRYAGTVILVSHDRDLIDEVATRIWHVGEGRCEDFKGSYEAFQSTLTAG